MRNFLFLFILCAVLLGYFIFDTNKVELPPAQTVEVSGETLSVEAEAAIPVAPSLAPKKSYSEFQAEVNFKRLSLERPALRKAFYGWLADDMYGYWDWTKWDYNGISRDPGKGYIACGYFVTTLLVDMGWQIDRIRLSQAASSVMIQEMTVDRKVLADREAVVAYAKKFPDETVFIIGLNDHTGFILKDASGVYFLHSSAYYHNDGVDKEDAATSIALENATYFLIGNLSDGPAFKKWANQ